MTRNFGITYTKLSSAHPLRGAEAIPASAPPSPRGGAGVVQFSRRPSVGGNHSAGASGADTHPKLIPFPDGSIITPSAILKPGDLPDSFRNVVSLIFVLIFLSSVAVFGGAFLYAIGLLWTG